MRASTRRAACALSLAGALAGSAASAGTVIVDFAVEAQVSGRDQAGRAWQAGADEITVLPRAPGLLSPFPAVQYRGELFEWIFGTGTLGLGGKLTNRTGAPLCFRFDEARIASNSHADGIPLRVSTWRRLEDGKWATLGSASPGKRNYFVPPSLCLGPQRHASISFSPDLQELFASRKMFDVRWIDDEPKLVERGVGNWVRIEVPVERAGRRDLVEVTLTATDSKARVSYY